MSSVEASHTNVDDALLDRATALVGWHLTGGRDLRQVAAVELVGSHCEQKNWIEKRERRKERDKLEGGWRRGSLQELNRGGGGFIKKFQPLLPKKRKMQLDKQATPISIKPQTPRHPTATRHPPGRSGQVSGSFGAWCSAPARSGVRGGGGGAERKARHPADCCFGQPKRD